MVSSRLRLELLKARANGTKQYQLARQLDMHPTVLSALVNSLVPVRDGDERVIRIGAALGLRPEECFETQSDEQVAIGA